MIDSKEMKIYLPKLKIEKIKKRIQVCPAPHPHSPTDVTSNWTSDIITPSCSHSTSSHQSSTKSKNPGSTTWIIQLSASMVDTTTGSSSWSSHCSNIPTNSPHLQCIQNGMGSIMSTPKGGGKMDTSGIRSTYQNIGTYSSLVCPEELREFGIRQTRSDPNGQSNCSDVLEQDGRYPCKGPVRLSPANMAVESGKEHSNISRILTREKKCDSRSGITPSQRCQRLETQHTDIQSHSTEMGTIQCRSFCSATQQTDPNIFQLEGRSSSSSSERNGTRVGSTDPICISPIHSDRQSTAENEAGSSVGSMFDHTTVESTAMVSFGTGNVHRFPSADSDEGRYVWNCWCNQRNYDPISAPVEAVLEFLTEECCFRFHYCSGRNESLSLKQVTLKLTMLMALTSAGRSSDIHGLDLKFRKFTPQGVEFTIAKLTKTRKSGPPKQILFPAFQSYRVLCPIACLRHYEKITGELRDTGMNTNPLFIAHCKPHKPVTSSTIARWLKEIMKEAGLDTSIFKAHSCRGAAVSAAKDHGVAVELKVSPGP